MAHRSSSQAKPASDTPHGVKLLPPAEPGRLVAARVAVHGDQPPRGFPG